MLFDCPEQMEITGCSGKLGKCSVTVQTVNSVILASFGRALLWRKQRGSFREFIKIKVQRNKFRLNEMWF